MCIRDSFNTGGIITAFARIGGRGDSQVKSFFCFSSLPRAAFPSIHVPIAPIRVAREPKMISGSMAPVTRLAIRQPIKSPGTCLLYTSEEDKLVVSRARKVQRFLSQPFFVAGQFTGLPGKYVPISETIRSFSEILEGKHDDIPESYFLNAGSIDDVLARVQEKSAEK